MIKIKYLFLLAILIAFLNGCEDPIDPTPVFESVPHGFAKLAATSSKNLKAGDPTSKLDGTLQWISIDEKVNVKSIDLYIQWTEGYIDGDKNPKNAAHGKRKLTTIANPGANRTISAISISSNDLFNLFKDVKFDYKDGKGSRPIFDDAYNSLRSLSNPFVPADKFILTWAFNAEDGKVYDSWSPGICGNTVGANCNIPFGVVCESDLGGTFTVKTTGDSKWGGPTGSACAETFEGELILSEDSEGVYTVKTKSPGGLTLVDYSFGGYYACYDTKDQAGLPTTESKGNLKLNDTCGKISIPGISQFAEAYKVTGVKATGKVLSFRWENEYGEAAKVEITRTDKDWPSNLN
jgi:hypothetical protein